MKGNKFKVFSRLKWRSKQFAIGFGVAGGLLAIGVAAQAISLDDLNRAANEVNTGVTALVGQLNAATSGITQVFSQDVRDKMKVDPNVAVGELSSYDPSILEGQAGIAAPTAEVPANLNTSSLILGKGEANKILSKAGQESRKKQLDQVYSLVDESYTNAYDVYENSDVVEDMDSSQEILKVLAANDVGQANILYMNNTLLAKSYEVQQTALQQSAVMNQLQSASLSNLMGSLQEQKILNAGIGASAEQAASDLGNGENQ
jgi:hypothetical protein